MKFLSINSYSKYFSSQNALYEELLKYPEYHKNLLTPTFDEERHIASRQSFIHKANELLSLEHTIQNLRYPSASLRIMIQLAPSATVKHSMGSMIFSSVLRSMGTERHYDLISATEDGKVTI